MWLVLTPLFFDKFDVIGSVPLIITKLMPFSQCHCKAYTQTKLCEITFFDYSLQHIYEIIKPRAFF